MNKDILEDLLNKYNHSRGENISKIIGVYEGSFEKSEKKKYTSFLEEIKKIENRRHQFNDDKNVINAIPWTYLAFLTLPLIGFLAGWGVAELAEMDQRVTFPIALGSAGGLSLVVYKIHRHFKYDKPKQEVVERYAKLD